MKIFTIFSITFILMACLFVGCGGDDDEDELAELGELGGYAGFASMKPGSWAQHNTPEGETAKYKYLGEDTWEGRQCLLLEFESNSDGHISVNQIWIDKVTGDIVLFLIKMDGEVMRMDIDNSQPPDVPGQDVPEDTPDVQQIGTDNYTTPTGKTVKAIIYSMQTPMGMSEFWASNEVPFGDVQDKLNGNVTSYLQDFGLSGAVRSISRQEAENAKPFGFPGIPGGDIPGDIPGGDIPGDIPGGEIVIKVGPGPRPVIEVSEPIQFFSISQGFIPLWGFESPGGFGDPNGISFPGPFQYGVLPANAVKNIGQANPPDLTAGQVYTIQVMVIKGFLPAMGNLTFTR